jgi:tetratricopeptide (TPR) repeat protein
MQKHFIWVIMAFVCFAGMLPTFVFGVEGEGAGIQDIPNDYEAEISREMERLEEENGKLYDKIDKEIDRLLNYYFVTITVIGVILTVVIGVFAFVLNNQRHTISKLEVEYKNLIGEVRAGIKEVRNYADETTLIWEKTTGMLADIEDNSYKAKAYVRDIENAERILRGYVEDVPLVTDAEEKRRLVKKISKRYPALTESLDSLYEAVMKGDIVDMRIIVNILRTLNINSEYNRAITLIESIGEAGEKSPLIHFNKGYALAKLGEYKEAIRANDRAIESEPELATAYYNRSCIYAIWGKQREMIEEITKAINIDVELIEFYKTDPDFDAYRDDPDFRRLVYPEEF